MRLGIVVSHPIQYYAPLFREIAKRLDLHVFYGQLASRQQQSDAGFGVDFEWDVDLTSGYSWSVLDNRSKAPSVSSFGGCDVPSFDQELKAKGIDVLLLAGWYQKAFLQAAWAAKRLHIPVIVRGDSQLGTPASRAKRLVKDLGYPLFLRMFDAALYVGQRSREYYRHYRFPQQRLFFSPHCVDNEWFSKRSLASERKQRRAEWGVDEDKRLVLFAGKLLAFKGPLSLVRAVTLLRLQGVNAEIVVAGAGPLDGRVRAEAEKLAVPLRALGFCNQSQMPSVYAAADVLALPSEHETWGLVCNEALACGTPIVVSDQVGCAPDLAGDDCVGRRFIVGSDAALAAALGRTIASPPSAQKILEVSSRYSVERAADGVEAAIHRIAP
jgi:glycosyltransferase involved in cell wall biosynthesis